MIDKELDSFLKPVFPEPEEREKFVKTCFKRVKAREMLLRAQLYTELANNQKKIGRERPAIQLIFLMALAEGVAKRRTGKSKDPIKDFFEYISSDDTKILLNQFKRTLSKPRLRFSSVRRILYEVRNRAVHGDEFWEFSLVDEAERAEAKMAGYTSYGRLTFGYLGKRGRKREQPIVLNLTYEELRDIFRRTAIENIKSILYYR